MAFFFSVIICNLYLGRIFYEEVYVTLFNILLFPGKNVNFLIKIRWSNYELFYIFE